MRYSIIFDQTMETLLPFLPFAAGLFSISWLAQCSGTKMSLLLQSLSFYGRNQDITHILNNMDVYILPVMNPDGYRYTWNIVITHDTHTWHTTSRAFLIVVYRKHFKSSMFFFPVFPTFYVLRTECGGRIARPAGATAALEWTWTETLMQTGAVSRYIILRHQQNIIIKYYNVKILHWFTILSNQKFEMELAQRQKNGKKIISIKKTNFKTQHF